MSEFKFSPLIVGVMRLGDWGAKLNSAELEKFIDGCLDMGLSDFDHADIYGGYTAEADFGEVLRRRPDLRKKIQLTTKCGIRMVTRNRPDHQIAAYDSGKAHILASVDNSLKDLAVEQIELLLLHRPDFLMNPYEIAEAFLSLETSGKVKHFGVSNFTPSQFEMLSSFTPLVNNQVEASILHLDPFEDGTFDQCLRLGVIPTAWSPVGGGSLFSDSFDPQIKRIREVAEQIAENHSASLDQILLAFLLKHPAGIVPVLGTSKLERIKTAKGALELQLGTQEWYALWQASKGEPIP